ncbi:MAG: putative toxin-antitoxin system toxin component, PIN family [Chitinispirillales bacterium]|jgi:putative PIN family toxin of toxin-antitoxin system|nr:putative toxin-antitoxin system toxin component, PIN family [Chitinispirillales bacterium]
MRIVIDTNVLISALFFNKFPAKFLEFALYSKEIKVIVTTEIISEYKRVDNEFAQKARRYAQNKTLSDVLCIFETISSKSNVKISRDRDDNKFIACAIDGKCKYIVSGDKHLLELKSHENVEIVTVRKFMDEYAADL